MDTEKRSVQFTATCQAPPQVVYSLLSDLQGHLVWGGEQQRGFFRLLSLDAPPGSARQGTQFSSRGTIPGSRRQFVDHSEVTEATENSVFAFTTKATVPSGGFGGMQAEFTNRYELTPLDHGCRVTYTFIQESVSHPMLRLSLPIVRSMTWKMSMPFMMKRGFDNLLKLAEARAAALQRRGLDLRLTA